MDKWLIRTSASTSTTPPDSSLSSDASTVPSADVDQSPKKKKLKSTRNASVRQFQCEWELNYFVIEQNDRPLCLLCGTLISVCKVYNIKRHYITCHQDNDKRYTIESQERATKLSTLKKQFLSQQKSIKKVFTESEIVTLASFKITWLLARKRKPFSDGELIKSCMIEGMNILLTDMSNKAEILRRIEDIQLSRRTFMRRLDQISNNLVMQLKAQLSQCVAFSIALDESTDYCHVAQLCVWVRYVDQQLHCHEELLKLHGMHDRTRGQDIATALQGILADYDLSTAKMVSITTDGAPCMIGNKNGLTSLFKKDAPHLLNFHCIIHQQNLCAKATNDELRSVMSIVVTIVNVIRAKALFHRQFVEFLKDVEAEYGDLLLHCEVRWLSRGKVLDRFIALLPHINDFLDIKGIKEYDQYLCDIHWIRDLVFLADITRHLNDLNEQLQGRKLTIVAAVAAIKAFICKLSLFSSQLADKQLRHFPQLQQSFSEEPLPVMNFIRYAGWVDEIKSNFQNRFQDLEKLNVPIHFIQSPETFPLADIPLLADMFQLDCVRLETELIDMQSAPSEVIQDIKQPILRQLIGKILSIFCSTYSCEATFSAMSAIKTKKRNKTSDESLENELRCAVSIFLPDFDFLTANMDCQISH